MAKIFDIPRKCSVGNYQNVDFYTKYGLDPTVDMQLIIKTPLIIKKDAIEIIYNCNLRYDKEISSYIEDCEKSKLEKAKALCEILGITLGQDIITSEEIMEEHIPLQGRQILIDYFVSQDNIRDQKIAKVKETGLMIREKEEAIFEKFKKYKPYFDTFEKALINKEEKVVYTFQSRYSSAYSEPSALYWLSSNKGSIAEVLDKEFESKGYKTCVYISEYTRDDDDGMYCGGGLLTIVCYL